jgi:predicted dehydrogenase
MLLPLKVTETLRIEPKAFLRFFRQKYKNPVRKGLHMMRTQGVITALRKYRSKMIDRRMENDQAIIIARVMTSGGGRFGFTRYLGETYIFDSGLIFEPTGTHGLHDVVLSKRTFGLLESYLPVPTCPLAAEIAAEILKENPWLRPSDPMLLPQIAETSCASAPARSARSLHEGKRQVFVIGFGSYIREYVLPHFRNEVVAALDFKAELISRWSKPPFPVYSNAQDIMERIARATLPLVIVATYHSDHPSTVLQVLDSNPSARVFVEKPAGANFDSVLPLIRSREQGAWIDVGFNRRYARLIPKLKQRLDEMPRPLVITARVKELKIPDTHWYFWPNQGTRITGNLCHWIDLVWSLVEKRPIEFTLLNSSDSVALGMLFEDGTLANLTATDLGDDLPGVEEQIEIRGGSTTIEVRNFKTLLLHGDGHSERISLFRPDKGHTAMYKQLRRNWLAGLPPAYPVEALRWVSYMTDAASQMFVSGQRTLTLVSDCGDSAPVGIANSLCKT